MRAEEVSGVLGALTCQNGETIRSLELLLAALEPLLLAENQCAYYIGFEHAMSNKNPLDAVLFDILRAVGILLGDVCRIAKRFVLG